MKRKTKADLEAEIQSLKVDNASLITRLNAKEEDRNRWAGRAVRAETICEELLAILRNATL